MNKLERLNNKCIKLNNQLNKALEKVNRLTIKYHLAEDERQKYINKDNYIKPINKNGIK